MKLIKLIHIVKTQKKQRKDTYSNTMEIVQFEAPTTTGHFIYNLSYIIGCNDMDIIRAPQYRFWESLPGLGKYSLEETIQSTNNTVETKLCVIQKT